MKLKNEMDLVKTKFEENENRIKEYAAKLKESKDYNDFETRLAFDCLRAFIGTNTMCEWYDKYNCNDQHIETLGKTALRELNII